MLNELEADAKINRQRLEAQEAQSAAFTQFLDGRYHEIISLIDEAKEAKLHSGQVFFSDGTTQVPFWGHTVPVKNQEGYTTSIFFGKENSGCLGPLFTTRGVAVHAYTEQNVYGGESRELAYQTVMINLNYGKITVMRLDKSGKQNIQEYNKNHVPDTEQIESLTTWFNDMWESAFAKIDADV